jgi:transcriptional regulator with XRE-family HTH domain
MATMDLGSRLLTWLRVKGLSQAQLAEKLNVSGTAVTFWCSGRNAPTQKNLELIVEVLGLTLAEFWGPLPEVPAEDTTTSSTTTAA